MERGHEIKILDHGYVRYVDSMGSDEAIVEAARMSTGRGFVSWEPYKRCKRCDTIAFFDAVNKTRMIDESGKPIVACGVLALDQGHDWQDFPRGDLGMLDFMYKNRHSTPFEFGELHVEVQAPIMVFREWHRHRTQAYSEFSARYSQMPNLHYLPAAERIQKQLAANRQGSGEVLDEREAREIVEGLAAEQRDVYVGYEDLIQRGVAKEVARFNTPVSRYSKMRAKTDLRNWLGFLNLRMAPNAQYEIRCYAQAVASIISTLWPRTYALFEEYDLHALRLSRGEIEQLKELLIGKEISLGLRKTLGL